jgi:hypothetical protein
MNGKTEKEASFINEHAARDVVSTDNFTVKARSLIFFREWQNKNERKTFQSSHKFNCTSCKGDRHFFIAGAKLSQPAQQVPIK